MASLELNIRIRSFGKDDSYGYCLPAEDADPARPRDIDIDLNCKMTLRLLLETLAHELVHAKQFARGELYQSSVHGKHRWQGKWMPAKLPNYWDLPWEIEAHGRETGLFIQWCHKERIGHLAWTQVS
tara:strand:+ start:2664 stop:3044 length:381 start_codon:yes stop_codon:yes gene_type:complete